MQRCSSHARCAATRSIERRGDNWVPDDRWEERSLAVVVVKPNRTVTPKDLRDFLSDKVARWRLPKRWTFVEAVPWTSVGKFDKRSLRSSYADGASAVFDVRG